MTIKKLNVSQEQCRNSLKREVQRLCSIARFPFFLSLFLFLTNTFISFRAQTFAIFPLLRRPFLLFSHTSRESRARTSRIERFRLADFTGFRIPIAFNREDFGSACEVDGAEVKPFRKIVSFGS